MHVCSHILYKISTFHQIMITFVYVHSLNILRAIACSTLSHRQLHRHACSYKKCYEYMYLLNKNCMLQVHALYYNCCIVHVIVRLLDCCKYTMAVQLQQNFSLSIAAVNAIYNLMHALQHCPGWPYSFYREGYICQRDSGHSRDSKEHGHIETFMGWNQMFNQ